MKIKLSLFFIFLFWVVCCMAASEEPKEKTDSLRYIFGLKIDETILYEYSGSGISQFELYSKDDASLIMWSLNNEYYIYSFSGDMHEVRAASLFRLLLENGLQSFVAYKSEIRKKPFDKYHWVSAIHLGGIREISE